MKKIKLLVFLGLVLGYPAFSYFSVTTSFTRSFQAGVIDLELEETLSRRSKKRVVVENTGTLDFLYQIQVLSSGECNFDLRIDRGKNLFYYGKVDDFIDWRKNILLSDESQEWTFRGFSPNEDCSVTILFRAENGFTNFTGFSYFN
ncbi:MAG: hypothetical protein ACQEP3_01500 [Patescibacteria group bacterium]